MSVSWPGPGFIDFANFSLPFVPYPFPDFQQLNFTYNLPPPLKSSTRLPLVRTTMHHKTTTRKPHHTTKKPHHTTKKPHHRTTTKHPHPTKTYKTHRPTKHPHTTKKPTKPHPTKHTHKPPTHKPPTTATPTNATTASSNVYTLDMTWDDATWILLNSFFIFVMQVGFGLLESGIVHEKNTVNIMMKNIVDIVLGGFTYWIFGFSLSYGASPGSNGFAGVGEYVVDSGYPNLGPVMTQFFFQLSFATTATTIVSGSMAERCNFKAYCVFSFFNTVIYTVPCKWVWGYGGWLGKLGCIDIAGSGCVHLLGGVSAYVGAFMLGPRLGRYDLKDPPPLGNPSNCIVGLFFLWWGWLAFNSGSTFGIVDDLWKFAARAAVTTMIASFGGGLTGAVYTLSKSGPFFDVLDIINPILGALVGVTAGCALYHTFDALVVGIIGGFVSIVSAGFADWTGVDDPVGATSVHGFCGIWGMVAVGLFAENDNGAGFSKGNAGVFRGGTLYLICIQMLACVSIIAWTLVTSFVLLFLVNLVVPLRMHKYEELLGADFSEHLLRKRFIGITPAESAFASNPHVQDIVKNSVVVGYRNPAHEPILQAFREINGIRRWSKPGTKYGAEVHPVLEMKNNIPVDVPVDISENALDMNSANINLQEDYNKYKEPDVESEKVSISWRKRVTNLFRKKK